MLRAQTERGPEQAPGTRFRIIGLGNPGEPYQATRHNIGFRVVDHLVHRFRATTERLDGNRYVNEAFFEGFHILLYRPLTYMNRSGESVADIAVPDEYGKIHLLVIMDDIALPLGVLRLRRRGSSGGQRGLASIIEAIGTDAVPRLRCGIGPVPEGVDPSEFVLSDFKQSELPAVQHMVNRAAQVVETVITGGIDAAMNRWNGSSVSGCEQAGTGTAEPGSNIPDDAF